MNMHRYFSVLFFVISLSFGSLLPMQPQDNKPSFFDSLGTSLNSIKNFFAPEPKETNKRKLEDQDRDDGREKRPRLYDSDEEYKEAVREAMKPITVKLMNAEVKEEKRVELLKALFTAKVTPQELQTILERVQNLTKEEIVQLMNNVPALMKQFMEKFRPQLNASLHDVLTSLMIQLTRAGVSEAKRRELLQALFAAEVTLEEVQIIEIMVQNSPPKKVCEAVNNVTVFMKNFIEAFRSQTQKTQQQSPLKQALALANFAQEDINNIPQDYLAYPTKALSYLLNGMMVNHLSMNKDIPNQGVENATGSDCFLIASFQVLSQLKPFMNNLEQLYTGKKTNDLQNEFLAFVSALRGGGSLVYIPENNASAVMRSFLVQNAIVGRGMKSGNQDACEFFLSLLDKLTENYTGLISIFSIKLVSIVTLTNNNVVTQEDVPAELVMSLSLNQNIDSCIKCFSEKETFTAKRLECGKEITVPATKELALNTPLPPILTLQLKRFNYDLVTNTSSKLLDPVSFSLNLELKNTKYQLVGIIVHSGTLTKGHYWAYTKDRFSGKWYRFNDEKRFEISDEEMSKIAAAGKENTGNGTPYMLFYERI